MLLLKIIHSAGQLLVGDQYVFCWGFQQFALQPEIDSMQKLIKTEQMHKITMLAAHWLYIHPYSLLLRRC
jgi:hypothetical protein